MEAGRSLRRMLSKFAWDITVNWLARSVFVSTHLRLAILNRLGMSIDPRVQIEPGCWFASHQVSIGPGTGINVGCFFDAQAPIRIGADVKLGPQVMIHTSAHDIGPPQRRCGTLKLQPVTIGDGVWVGLRATILAGVSVGEGCVIAAGALVISDCAPHGLYAGVPARRIRDLDPEDVRDREVLAADVPA